MSEKGLQLRMYISGFRSKGASTVTAAQEADSRQRAFYRLDGFGEDYMT